MGTQRILVIEDDPDIVELLQYNLEREGFEVCVAKTGEEGKTQAAECRPSLILLDLMLPRTSGLDVCRDLRGREDTKHTPLIMVTAKGEESDVVLGLELGADDYVTKPFSPRELAARVNGVLRRTAGRQPESPSPLVFGDLKIDALSREVTLEGVNIEMTPKEFDVLAFLAASPRQVFSRAQLLESVWQSSPEWQDPATVTVHVRRIRNKIETDPEHPRWITTVWGVGYRFEP